MATVDVAKGAQARWVEDPCAFASDVLGLSLWGGQREILTAVAQSDRVTVRSGHKIGKSLAAACVAWWFALTRPRARVIMTSASARQVSAILWREVSRLYRSARMPLGGRPPSVDPSHGWGIEDGREIVGFSTDDPERMAGFSGANLLFVVDEASGVDERLFEALEGNRAGGAKILALSNPTRIEGTFWQSHQPGTAWRAVHLSSWDAARHTPHVPGLATLEWCEEKRREWGESDPRYRVRVLGEFPDRDVMTVMAASDVESAQRREGAMEGPLRIGVDVARGGADATTIAVRRGMRVIEIISMRTDRDDEILGRVIAEARRHRHGGGERVEVRVDSIGVGAGLVRLLEQHTDGEVQCVPVDAGRMSESNEHEYVRDDLWFGVRDWLRAGGSIPHDRELAQDLLSAKYGFTRAGKIKVDSKEIIRKRIGRSPDKADAVALAVFDDAHAGSARAVFEDASPMPRSRW